MAMDAVHACGCHLSKVPAEKENTLQSVIDSLHTSKLSIIGRELHITGHPEPFKYEKKALIAVFSA